MEKRPSKKEIQELNLKSLIQQYKDSGPAAKGYNKLISLIQKRKEKDIAWLLRNHSLEGSVYLKRELDFRYEIDYLIKFYSLLQLAIFTGYIPSKIPEELRNEIIFILDQNTVKKYYEKNYPLYLPRVILKAAKKNLAQQTFGDPGNFRELLLLDYKEDKEMEAFLFLLDGFSYSGLDIDDFNELLGSKAMIKLLLSKPRKDETRFEQAFWGFIKHNDFMQEYRQLLEKCKNDILRSSFWHFRGYWFKNMKDLMYDKYLKGIQNIKQMTDNISPGEFKKNNSEFKNKSSLENKEIEAKSFKEKNYSEWKNESDEQIREIYQTVDYNLNPEHSKPLVEYLLSI